MFRSRRINLKFSFLCLVGFSALCLIYYLLNYKKQSAIFFSNDRPIVLLWTKTNTWKPKELNDFDCEFKCTFTYDRVFFNMSNGVMFYWNQISSADLPHYHPEGQYWILIESPSYLPKLQEAFRRQVNWPVAYKTDPHTPAVFGKTVKREVAIPYKLRTHFLTKTRNVTWFVSQCKTKSKRDVFAKELSNFIDLDIYGSCGNLTCGVSPYKKGDPFICYRLAEKQYKFYFSSENFLCKEHITEKAFNIFDFELIPIVDGGANYSAMLPQNSYIDARNFTKPSKLADYLHKVGSDEQLYYSYFKWKSDYKVLDCGSWKKEKLQSKMCDICKGLYNPSSVKDFRGSDIYVWWIKRQFV